MKKILFIATGGTIASKKSDSGLKPQISPEELLSYIPSLSQICAIDTLQLFSLDSTNMEPKHWIQIV
ncbi:MAG: asparaginase, partial [Agathobacter sp.]|nr:asparaginase [Agathobacter sp.]